MQSPRRIAIGIAVFALLVVGAFYYFARHDYSPSPSAANNEEACTTGVNGERNGYLRTVLLCSADSQSCSPDQRSVFQAHHAGAWNAEAMLIPDIPDGDVITGGDMVDPSPYHVTSMGFSGINVTNYTNSSDYCTQHYWYYLHANWISSDPLDKARITICVYFDKWDGPKPAEACAPPTSSPSQQ
jgi:hypothetical protein